MRIHYLSDSAVPSSRANSVHVMKMCAAFSGHGHDVILSAYRGKTDEDVYAYYGVPPAFEISNIAFSPIPGVKRFMRALSGNFAVRRGPAPDLIYGRDLYSMLMATASGLPFIYESHMAPRSWADRQLTRLLLRRGNLRRLVVISGGLAAAYRALYPWFPDEKFLVAHDGADVPGRLISTELSARWPGRPGVPQLGYVGSFYPGKGAETVVELAGRLPDLDFHIVGGQPEDVARIRRTFSGENLFLYGYVPHHQVAEYMSRMDIALLPPQKNVLLTARLDIGAWMSPLKLFEYMAARLPIIASALPVVREVLTHEENAILVPPGDTDAWMSAVRRLAAHDSLRTRLADKAYDDFVGQYTWASRARRVLEGLQ